MFNKRSVYDAILKPKQEQQFTVGTVVSIDPLQVMLDGDTVAIPCQSLTGLLGMVPGNRVILLRYGRQFVAVGVLGKSVLAGGLQRGYRYVSTLYHTEDDTFIKGGYPWLRAIKVKTQAAGGAAGSIRNDTGASGSGAGGGYAESFITDTASLDSVIDITVGKGGLAVAGGNGNPGGDSSFGDLVVATGGGGGNTNGGTNAGGRGTAGDLLIYGSWGTPAGEASTGISASGPGGSSFMGGGGSGYRAGVSGNGGSGRLYGGGGGGCRRGSSGTATGGDGADGIVIVELYA